MNHYHILTRPPFEYADWEQDDTPYTIGEAIEKITEERKYMKEYSEAHGTEVGRVRMILCTCVPQEGQKN